jgi:hypothetical protein
MIKGLGFTVRGYKAKYPEFPNQSTVDQFFDPAQFEAYRELGYVSAASIVDDMMLEGSRPTVSDLRKKFRNRRKPVDSTYRVRAPSNK